MPVRKFRTIEEMNAFDAERRRLAPNDPRLHERIRAHWAEWSRLVPTAIPRGLRKYRTIEEMTADREQWERARIERLRK